MKTNKFKLGNFHLTTCDMGRLVPIGLQEVLPGDIFSMRTSILTRVTPMLAPVMHPIKLQIYHFFVPNRLLWRYWGEFVASAPKCKDMLAPFTQCVTTKKGTLADYMNVPLKKEAKELLAFPFLAYLMIWKDYFADDQLNEDLIAQIDEFLVKVYESKGGDIGKITIGQLTENVPDLTAFAVAWSKDYFTSARNEPQLGDDVVIPVHQGASANGQLKLTNARIDKVPLWSSIVRGEIKTGGDSGNVASVWSPAIRVGGRRSSDGANVNGIQPLDIAGPFYSTDDINAYLDSPASNGGNLTADAILNVDGQDVLAGQGISLQELRNSLALGRINEHRNMYGTRFVEYLNYLGVKTSDYRLQRPLLLGSGQSLLQISEVLQTAEAQNGVVGSMKGHGLGSVSSNRFIRGFEEHGFILSFCVIRPKTIYTDGIPKMWSRRIAYDWWQKELQNLGMQPVKNKELFFQGSAQDDEVFGYQDIWQEYRTNQSRISGDFRDYFDDWHLAREFNQLPALNQDFIACNPSKRIFVEQTHQPFLLMCRNFAVARRLVSRRANPKTF